MRQHDLLGWTPPVPQIIMGDRDGQSYSRERDLERLDSAMGRIFRLLGDGRWHTVEEMTDAGRCSPTGATARYRDLSKPKFGGFKTESKNFGGGLWKYRRVIS
jgi:hypothetical protein